MRPNIKLLEGLGHLPIHAQITNNLRHAISTGQLPSGTQLPSVRDLAEELNVASNTVARAYQALHDEGLVITQSGRGTFVTQLIEPGSPRAANQAALLGILDPAIAAVRALGASPEEILGIVQRLLTDDRLVVALVGINDLVVRKWRNILEQEYQDLKVTVIGVTIDEVRRDLAGVLNQLHHAYYVFSLLTTYADSRHFLEPHNKRVVPLLTEVSLATHEALARLPADGMVGLVADDQYANNVLALIGNYCDPSRIKLVSAEHEAEIDALMGETRTIVYTFTPSETVIRLARPDSHLIELQYLPNRSCFDQVRQILAEYHAASQNGALQPSISQ